jgi:hypothetical protein
MFTPLFQNSLRPIAQLARNSRKKEPLLSEPKCKPSQKLSYKFVKKALIRKFGQDWYEELDRIAQEYYLAKSQLKSQ